MDEHGSPRGSEPLSAFESSTFNKDVQIRVNETVGSASISPSGRDVVLASREGLHIIDLDSPFSPPRYVPHRSQWEVADVQWSPFSSRDSWIVSTSNQKALVWNLNLTSPHAPIEHTLHAHSNAITDINFSAHHPDILATCAVDSYVHCWDLRRPAKPIISFAEWFSGATQVKWNRQDSHILASSHQKKLMIWDDRKGAHPLREIEAHATQIYGVDWNRLRPEALLTCSLDRTIKFWDYTSSDDIPERVIRTPYPVWRARHTPFGWGVLAMPKRHDFNVHMYDRRLDGTSKPNAIMAPVHSFEGHEDQVKEFLWRSRGGIDDGIDNRDFQMVSWGMDRYLRLHRIDDEQLEAVGHKKGSEVHKKLNLTRAGASYRSFRDEKQTNKTVAGPGELRPPRPPGLLGLSLSQSGMGKNVGLNTLSATAPSGMQARKRAKKAEYAIDWMGGVKMGKAAVSSLPRNSMRPADNQLDWDTPESLSDEITYVGQKYRTVDFELADVNRRTATVTLNGPWGAEGKTAFIRVTFKFPSSYPVSAVPTIAFEKTTSAISEQTSRVLKHGLRSIAEHFVLRNCGCLEAMITYLLGERDLEDSFTLLPGGNGVPADESSSDEDDEDDQDLDMSATDLGGALANASVPLPKTCGAVFGGDGRLICFFPPKSEPKPLFDLDALRGRDKLSRSTRLFEEISRWRTDSPELRDRLSDEEDIDALDDSSEFSLSSSTSCSSDSSDDMLSRRNRFMPPRAWRGGKIRFQKSSTTHSSGGIAQKAAMPKAKSYISIVDTRDLLPARKELAEEYRIFGDGPSVCAHNASTALKYHLAEIAQIWELMKLILFNQVPLEILPQTYRNDPVLVVARRAIARVKKKDSAFDVAGDNVDGAGLNGRVKWGNHPMAGKWLIPRLFQYFEKLADVQMLAMMSCIFAEPAACQPVANRMMQVQQHELPMAMKSPGFSLDYFPSEQVAWSLFHPRPKSIAASKHKSSGLSWKGFERFPGTYGSASSSNGPWSADVPLLNEPVPLYSNASTPPRHSISNIFRTNYPHSYSTSPDKSGLSVWRKPSSNGLLKTSNPFDQPLIHGGMSPPADRRFRDDEPELSTSAPASAVTWGETTVVNTNIGSTAGSGSPVAHRRGRQYSRTASDGTFDSLPIQSDSEESSLSSDDEHFDAHSRPSRPPSLIGRISSDRPANREVKIHVTLKNRNLFDDEAHASIPLLDPAHSAKHAAYRTIYAEQLSLWQLPITRSEVLKFNGLTSYWPGEMTYNGKEEHQNDGDNEQSAVDKTEPGNGTVTFEKRKASRQLQVLHCSICWRPVEGLHVPCQICGVGRAHKDCIAAWNEEVGEEESWCDDGNHE